MLPSVADVFQPYVQKLVDKEVLTERDLDAKRLKPFRLTAKRMELARDKNSSLRWCFGTLQQIERMARAMGSLVRPAFNVWHGFQLTPLARVLARYVPYLPQRDRRREDRGREEIRNNRVRNVAEEQFRVSEALA